MPDTTPGQRFIQLIHQLGLTKNAFAQSLGKTATVIQHIVDERNKPGYDLLNRVCEVYPNVSGEWLLRGLGPMLRETAPAPVAAPAAAVPGAIDISEVPGAARRRHGNLLQPADIAATLALTSQSPNGHYNQAAAPGPPAPAAATAPAVPPVVGASPLSMPVPPPPPSATATVSPAAPPATATAAEPAAPLPTVLPPAAPTPTLPDPTYLAAALHTQHLQHQLALAEQRNQHLLEQQTLLRQMLELVQRP